MCWDKEQKGMGNSTLHEIGVIWIQTTNCFWHKATKQNHFNSRVCTCFKNIHTSYINHLSPSHFSTLHITSMLCSSSGHCIDHNAERRSKSQSSHFFSSWVCADLQLFACRLWSDWGNHIMDTLRKWGPAWEGRWSSRTSVLAPAAPPPNEEELLVRLVQTPWDVFFLGWYFSWQKLCCSPSLFNVKVMMFLRSHSHSTWDVYRTTQSELLWEEELDSCRCVGVFKNIWLMSDPSKTSSRAFRPLEVKVYRL